MHYTYCHGLNLELSKFHRGSCTTISFVKIVDFDTSLNDDGVCEQEDPTQLEE